MNFSLNKILGSEPKIETTKWNQMEETFSLEVWEICDNSNQLP